VPVVVDLQLFSWQLTGHDWGRWPTAKEADLMTWLAIIAGVDGYLYYTYYDRLADPFQSLSFSQPKLWNAVKKTAAMVNEIKTELLEYDRFYTDNPLPYRYYSVWNTEAFAMVIAINTSAEDSLFIQIPLDIPYSSPQLIFNDIPGTLLFTDQHLEGWLAPTSAQFYRVMSASTVNHDGLFPHQMSFEIFPNPTNSQVRLSIDVPLEEKITVKIYSVQGRLVESFFTTVQPGHKNQITFSVARLPAGIYLAQLASGDQVITRKWTHLP
ncbi:MAG: T9SS type A sorting domain-containing protein, partial [Candidatus Marinimicrobia bacterium]|nr:T9SS type A sorting domain-containing protein [Candidatus Neomarinimicrobiota bacterium]